MHAGASGLGLVNTFVMARAMGATGRGEVAFLTTIGTLVAFLATLSVQEYFGNRVAREPSSVGQVLGAVVALGAALGSVGALVAWASLRWVPFLQAHVDPVALASVLITIPCSVAYMYLTYVTRATGAHRTANIGIGIMSASGVGINTALALSGHLTSRLGVISWCAGQALAMCVLWMHFIRRGDAIRRPPSSMLRRGIAFGSKAHLGGVMNTGSYRLDYWILGSIGGPTQVGIYSVAASWFEALFLAPQSLSVVMRPRLVAAEREEAAAAAAQAVRVAAIVTVVAGGAMYFAAPFLCEGVFGAEFAASTTLLRILIPGAIGICLLKLLGISLTAQGRPLSESGATAVGFGVAVVLYLLTIPTYLATGAAWSSTMAYLAGGAAAGVIFLWVFRPHPSVLLPRVSDITSLLPRRRTESP